MSARESPIGDDDLQAFVDGRLPPERKGTVEVYLAANPDAAAAVAADAEIRAALRTRLDSKLKEPIPARLRIANIAAERRRRAGRRFAAVAAAAGWLTIGTGLGWFGNAVLVGTPVTAGATTRDAITAYRTFVVERVHPVEVAADQEAHLVQWLSRRTGTTLAAPNLTDQGFKLMGGRLLPAGREPAAMFMYADAAGARLTLYVKTGSPDAAAGFRFEHQDDVSAFSWADRDVAYVVTARTDRPHLLSVAESVDHQVRTSPRPGAAPL